ncbi:MAG: hypothetical protein NVS9B12_06980 [Vulcanimicrobiaceae bacterium]
MKWFSALALSLLCACASGNTGGGTLAQALLRCQRGASHVEILLSGRVARVLGVRHGRNGAHEGFLVAPKDGGGSQAALKVEDNIDLTGYIPLQRGDTVEIVGQYECNDGVVHWTHRDPAGRHPSGYVKVHDRTYQ